MITKIAKNIADKHGERVLVDLEDSDKEFQQRVRAMGATFQILGLEDVYIDLNSRRTALIFTISYTVSYLLIRLAS